jgi:hypothetical protein
VKRWRHWLPLSAGIAGFAVTVALAASDDRGPRPVQPLLRAAKGAVSLSNSRNGSAVLSAANMAPGQSVSGTVSIFNKGKKSGALRLSPVNLNSPTGPGGGSLADVLRVRIEDQTGGGIVYQGPLRSLPVTPLGGIRKKARRTYLFTASLPDAVGDGYAGTSAQADLRWTASFLKQKSPCGAKLTGPSSGTRLTGTVGGDRITGRRGPDVIRGLAGHDCLYGKGGDDRLLGGRDGDRLFGGHGADLLNGGGDSDRLQGGAGNDRIIASGGRRDVVRCGPGIDRARVDHLDRVIGCESVVRP